MYRKKTSTLSGKNKQTCGSLCSVLCVCVCAVFPVWRGIGASNGVGGGWSQSWGRCLRWEPGASPAQRARIPVFDYPVWLVLCRGGRARLVEVYQRGKGAIRLPADMLSIKLPQLFDIHQVPKVRGRDVLQGFLEQAAISSESLVGRDQRKLDQNTVEKFAEQWKKKKKHR